MRHVKSCGILVMRTQPQLSFLLMQQHSQRYDLPKGHIEVGEDELGCALRELYEETGIPATAIHLDFAFRFTNSYTTHYNKFGNEKIEKTVVIFLGWLMEEVTVTLSEHGSYQWVNWNPPHIIQKKMINPLLEQLDKYFQEDRTRIIC
ncbi:bis(5'-nucleosyl)-tetraphosphatase [Limnofasciculus baicalensis]|uniref:Bis(5'-nucleosyl)-tetraphosphatase [asymmetrical] n=1 Tax=Limnofasciculus baicalensis BBK-W-15 TaxID=2699891 RepID=A0AAE3KN80_9CYAN|nr:NUDIX domain-containing protein [Limnofasciculus baicalensis]MCP2729526.1 NUDIX domain-containing protein [Limnofasciculus baicalensis BBK-W-15]